MKQAKSQTAVGLIEEEALTFVHLSSLVVTVNSAMKSAGVHAYDITLFGIICDYVKSQEFILHVPIKLIVQSVTELTFRVWEYA